MDFWKKFDQEWAELNSREAMRHKANSISNMGPHGQDSDKTVSNMGPHGQDRDKTVSNMGRRPSGPHGQDRVETVFRSSSSDRKHDGSQPPCHLVWTPSLLLSAIQPRSRHAQSCP